MKTLIYAFSIALLLDTSALPVLAAGLPIQRPGQAVAATYAYRATTMARIKKLGAVIAGDRSWQCGGTQCASRGQWPVPDVAGCQALAAQVGEITSYGYAGNQLNPDQLSQCNRAVGNLTPVAPTQRFAPEGAPIRAKVSAQPGQVGGGFAAGAMQPPHVPKTVTVEKLTVKGAGFAPKIANVPGLTVRGADFSPKVATVSPLTIKGAGFNSKTVTTEKLQVKGMPFSPKTATVAKLTVTGKTFTPKAVTTDLLTVKGSPNRIGNIRKN